MRIESSVTSVSWIPSEAITSLMRIPMDIGIGHYDIPPPEYVDDAVLDELSDSDRLRAANRLAAWIEVEDGRIVDAGYSGRAVVGSTSGGIGPAKITFQGVGFPVLQDDPVVREGTARFVQTVGTRSGAPFPRKIDRPPYVRITGPTTWVTLALEIDVDGSSRHEVVGAAPFPRHWIYDRTGALVEKSGLIDWSEWTRVHDHDRSPWNGVQCDAVVAEVETELERSLARDLMALKPAIRTLDVGDRLTVQGEVGSELFLVLDGMFAVDVDGEVVAEICPGSIVGERAVLEGGSRTATVTALTAARVAAVRPAADDADLAEVAAGHRREDR